MMSVAKNGVKNFSAAALKRTVGLKKRTCMVELRFGIWDASMAILIGVLVMDNNGEYKWYGCARKCIFSYNTMHSVAI